MIDLQARAKLAKDRENKQFLSTITEAIKNGNQGDSEDELLSNLRQMLSRKKKEENTAVLLDKIGQAVAKVYTKIPMNTILPRVFPITGRVKADIATMPNVKINNFTELTTHLQAISLQLKQLTTAISLMDTKAPEIKIPEIKMGKLDFSQVSTAITALEKKLKQTDNSDVIDALYEVRQVMESLRDKPTFIPPAVTNVSINALDGGFHATLVTIGGTATPLPAVPAVNRRSIIVYNGSGNTIYLGGSTVATSGTGQGLPVLTGSYSPASDAGVNTILYGIAGSSSNVNVLEIQDINIGR